MLACLWALSCSGPRFKVHPVWKWITYLRKRSTLKGITLQVLFPPPHSLQAHQPKDCGTVPLITRGAQGKLHTRCFVCCMSECVCVCVPACRGQRSALEVRGHPRVSLLRLHAPFYKRQGSLIGMELFKHARLAGQWTPGICVSSPHPQWNWNSVIAHLPAAPPLPHPPPPL